MVPPAHSITLVPHHKSGEHVAWSIYASLCCKAAHNALVELGSVLTRCAQSGSLCDQQRIDLHYNGLPSPPGRAATYGSDRTLVHFVRHPSDVVVSGYRYHSA